jgi:hypothetical protein
MMKSTPVAVIGSMAGGAVGGYVGAKKDRQKRGSIGGGVGGVLGPLGAALGGYIGGRKADPRAQNPSPMAIALAVGAGVAAVGVGYAGYKYWDKRRALGPAPDEKPASLADALQGVVGSGTLEDAPLLVSDVVSPIALRSGDVQNPQGMSKVPALRIVVISPEGERVIVDPPAVIFQNDGLIEYEDDGIDRGFVPTPQKSIAYLVTGLSPEASAQAYELALLHIDRGVNWDDSAQRDEATAKILAAIAPKLDWSKGLKPYTYGDPAWQAWAGVQLVGAVANQSLANKRALGA